MLLLEAVNIKKSFGEHCILSFDRFSVYQGERVGIVGLNGAGKTTLLQILSGALLPDEGAIRRAGSVSYVKQLAQPSGDMDPQAQFLKEWHVRGKETQDTVSGGEAARLKLAGSLSLPHQILFADEPTANLDLDGVAFLKKTLLDVETLLIVSHDRDLLDVICTRIVEIRGGALYFYDGGYRDYERQREEKRKREWTEYQQYQEEKQRLERVYTEKKRKADTVARRPKNMSPRECRLNDFLSTHKSTDTLQLNMQRNAKAVLSRIEHLQVKERPKEIPRIRLDFSLTNPPRGKILISCEKLSFSYPGHEILKSVSFQIPNGSKTALIGGNGAGKTTLLNLITSGDPKIRIAPSLRFGYFYQGLENLSMEKNILENVMENSVQREPVVRGILARLLFHAEDIRKPIHVLSGGERMKVALAKLIVSGANMLILDEPTNFLDMPSIQALQEILKDYEGTILFVSHDKAFADGIADHLLVIENHSIHAFDGNLTAYEQSKYTKKAPAPSRLILEMRLAKLSASISSAKNTLDKEALELEYRQTAALLREA